MPDEFAQIRAEARSTLAEQMRIDAARKAVPNDGKFRVATLSHGSLQLGLSYISYRAGQIFDDPALIELLERNGVAFEVVTAAAIAAAPSSVTVTRRRRGAAHVPVGSAT